MLSAPNENPVNTSIASFTLSPLATPVVAQKTSGANTFNKTMNRPPKPSTARPATPSPITEPPPKDTASALLRLVRAACAVRTLALVAIRIPIKPASALKNAPIINATAISQCELL